MTCMGLFGERQQARHEWIATGPRRGREESHATAVVTYHASPVSSLTVKVCLTCCGFRETSTRNTQGLPVMAAEVEHRRCPWCGIVIHWAPCSGSYANWHRHRERRRPSWNFATPNPLRPWTASPPSASRRRPQPAQQQTGTPCPTRTRADPSPVRADQRQRGRRRNHEKAHSRSISRASRGYSRYAMRVW